MCCLLAAGWGSAWNSSLCLNQNTWCCGLLVVQNIWNVIAYYVNECKYLGAFFHVLVIDKNINCGCRQRARCTNGVKGQHFNLKFYILVILQNNHCSVQREHWATKSTLFSTELGRPIGGLILLCNKWSRVQRFSEGAEGESTRASALGSTTWRPWNINWWTLKRCFTASLSSSHKRSNLAVPPLSQKWF